MAVQSNTEWKVEEAVIAALEANVDVIAGSVPVVRALADVEPVYPCIVVQCVGVQHPQTWGGSVGIEDAQVELMAYTTRKADPTTFAVTELLGIIRDTVRDGNFVTTLSSIVNFTAFGTNEEGFSRVVDSERIRVRAMIIRVLCNVSDI